MLLRKTKITVNMSCNKLNKQVLIKHSYKALCNKKIHSPIAGNKVKIINPIRKMKKVNLLIVLRCCSPMLKMKNNGGLRYILN